ncbi:uncharacterized protein CDV56_104218 [Aspergillus thermomutatus]|uniref:Uncharacterized protein n=1 Tax=Aspergillus thermomutatus TaxID=41047 RepID=A0A397HJ79_ASPTH|nr:uncharacterized protein CDV56_104218 [Aspergillus thermomutatus]RHZ63049.1 hypothetical protein CDV56_104218 [Aspergillus thermomutatus]
MELSIDRSNASRLQQLIAARATQAILKTRDGLLRAAVPSPLGSCKFLSDITNEEMFAALRRHKELMKEYPRAGAGIEAYVDASDTGYTIKDPQTHAQKMVMGVDGEEKRKSVFSDGVLNGLREIAVNGYPNGLRN